MFLFRLLNSKKDLGYKILITTAHEKTIEKKQTYCGFDNLFENLGSSEEQEHAENAIKFEMIIKKLP